MYKPPDFWLAFSWRSVSWGQEGKNYEVKVAQSSALFRDKVVSFGFMVDAE